MPGEFDGKHLKLWTPATYRIQVEGVLDEIWADSLAGMRISSRKRADQSTVTTLTGLTEGSGGVIGGAERSLRTAPADPVGQNPHRR